MLRELSEHAHFQRFQSGMVRLPPRMALVWLSKWPYLAVDFAENALSRVERPMTPAERTLLLAIAAVIAELAADAGIVTSSGGETIDARRLRQLDAAVRAEAP